MTLEASVPKKLGMAGTGKKIGAKLTPYKVQLLATLLQNIYWNGFKERRGTSYRIDRSRLKNLAEVERFEVGTLKKLVERLKADGFVLYPLDQSCDFSANEWIFDKHDKLHDKLRKLPLADDAAIRNADDRTDDVF
jgi:hypothetical protein